MEMSAKDEKIAAELDSDSRQSFAQIGKKIGLNKNLVSYRVARLEKLGIIRGYYTIIDTSKLGYSSFRLYLKLQYADPVTEKEIIEFIVKAPSSWWVGETRGKWDLVAIFWMRNVGEFISFWDSFMKKYRNYVETSDVHLYHMLYHYRLPFTKKIQGDHAEMEVIGGGEQVAVDETDRKILRLLGANARKPLLEIANECNLSPGAAAYRIRNLQKKNIILAFRTKFDMDKLGYAYHKADFNLKSFERLDEMMEYAKQHHDIFYLDKAAGGFDFEVEFYVKDDLEFYSAIDHMRSRFSDVMKNYESFTIPRITKLLYAPA